MLNALRLGRPRHKHERVTWTAPDETRTDPPLVAGERAALAGWLDFHRGTLPVRCQGLTGEQLPQEYARHNGHADLLRERIDGVTGD